jgi:hypothetical protein
MPDDRFLNQYDEAQSLLMEAIWEKYASGEKPGASLRGPRAIDVLRADAKLERSRAELVPA